MYVRTWIAVFVLALASPARADHMDMPGMDDGSMAAAPAAHSMWSAGVGLVAARYDVDTYAGDYQGVLPSLVWMRGRFGASATVGLYRLTANGAEYHGLGDVTVSAMATLWSRGASSVSAMLPVLVPTGNHDKGFGMGVPMFMPMLAAATRVRRFDLGASAGYGYMPSTAGHHHHADMGWPLVDPMNMQEVIWSANAYASLARDLRFGVRASGAFSVGPGVDRLVGGVRSIWTAGAVDTAFEFQVGLAGDPFKLRGLVESAVHF